MPQKFDPTKPVQTRDGKAARILCADLKDDTFPIVAAISRAEGESIVRCTAEGRASPTREYGYDLVNVCLRYKQAYWVNVYPDTSRIFVNRADADNYPCADGKTRVACVKVEIDCWEGGGLDAS